MSYLEWPLQGEGIRDCIKFNMHPWLQMHTYAFPFMLEWLLHITIKRGRKDSECSLHRFMLEERGRNDLECSLHRLGFEVMHACYSQEGREEMSYRHESNTVHGNYLISKRFTKWHNYFTIRSPCLAPTTFITKVQNGRKVDRSWFCVTLRIEAGNKKI